MSHWPAYPAYKDAGVEWLGEIPAHWEMSRLRYVCELNPSSSEISDLPSDTKVTFLPMEKIGEDGSIEKDENREIEEVLRGYTYFKDGDVIVAKITPCFENKKGALLEGLTNGIGFGTTELHVLRPGPRTNPMFLFYLTRSHAFRVLGVYQMYGAAGQQRVPEDFISNFETAIPLLSEQRAIAAFLDRETANLDALTRRFEQLLDGLEERRAALISHAVTKGLDPDVEMKASEIPWLGEIPAHWKVRRNKWIFKELNERSETGEEELLSVSHITGVTPRSEKDVNMFMAESLEGYKRCHPGDLVINTMWAWMGALGVTEHDGIVSPSYNVYRIQSEDTGNYVPKYLDHLYRTPEYVCEINRFSKGVWSSRLRLYPDAFFEMQTLTPPVAEQNAITAYLDWETTKLDALAAKVRAAIERLDEYRTALISAAVTGKIDVRRQVGRTWQVRPTSNDTAPSAASGSPR
jgi:type I restriction enzyme, S subunit